ncbi:ASCH domain-containing protein [Paenibacillus radicis (ex Xue et al. 2023)]|uniref:ASCH domain-containing protein n=1 Tax=Paenibacillus radicis (ex Xue et al. 2023) TaxID=2972489 RepID=A0ABT1YJU3_9BACL|nr:ASCH domain-containing protein [Paenibacillus radicis (ex Xue et al. 2023)]MCR8633468.1 ASCH domain-containing protein [Paenibacillus radicis (ex Xue et al. 2023)]
MKALTIHQPWATLIALGEKRFETRSWATKYRGPLAIHAGKKVDKEICRQEPFKTILEKHGYTADNLSTGVVVAVANLSEWYEVHIDHTGDAVLISGNVPAVWVGKDSNEFNFGWYDDGRFAWGLTNVRILPFPTLARGQQGLWNWDGGTTE